VDSSLWVKPRPAPGPDWRNDQANGDAVDDDDDDVDDDDYNHYNDDNDDDDDKDENDDDDDKDDDKYVDDDDDDEPDLPGREPRDEWPRQPGVQRLGAEHAWTVQCSAVQFSSRYFK
jgi:hypothetical protein